MSNTLLTIGMITNEALAVLENNLQMTKQVNREYSDYFAQSGAKIGDTVQVRKPPRYVGRDGASLAVEGSTESSVPIVLNHQYGCDISFTTKELTLDIDDFSDRFIKPMVASVSNQIDALMTSQWVNVWNVTGTPGTPGTSLNNYLDAKVLLDNEATPVDDLRAIVIDSNSESQLIRNITTLFNPTKEIADQYKDGSMGRAAGFKWSMDQNIATQTVGTFAANVVGNAVTATNTVASGNSIVTGGWTAADFLNAGDVITFSKTHAVNPQSRVSTGKLRNFVVLAKATADGAGSMTITVAPAIIVTNPTSSGQAGGAAQFGTVDVQITATDILKVVGTSNVQSPQGLAFHRDAFTFASADLELPQGVWMAKRVTSKKLGISIRAVKAYDINNDRAPLRLDVLCGAATLRPELACRIAN